MTITEEPAPATTEMPRIRSLALDLTRACQATCDHCYNHSGPGKTTGAMTRDDWLSVLDQAAAMGAGRVQFIGGEPTLHPDLPKLINHAVDSGLAVEIFSNLIHIRPHLWPVLRQRGVSLATSYYSDLAEEHDRITRHRGSYQRTKANITKALGFRIPLRAALVRVRDGQRITEATAELRELGVTHIRTDHLRAIGRGAGDTDHHDVNELCGNCAQAKGGQR
ncbi:radical SAM protein [Streptomyces sp. CA-111067]|uniref:radical SAM protein n=1 Tax=Streptomyces sp. CA-111067 TaxID=3240046 RepID=UPI003D956E4D